MSIPTMQFPAKSRDVIRSLSKVASLRTVMLKVEPAPFKLSERRAVLNALQQIVKIEVFKKMTPVNSFMSVLKNQDDMKRLVDRSPLEFSIVTDKPTTGVLSFLTSAPSTSAIIEDKADSPDNIPDDVSPSQARKAAAEKTEKRRFTVEIWPKQAYVHATGIRASPLHGPWPPRGKVELESVLKTSLPDNIAARGLSDWETGGQVPDAANAKKLEDVLFGHVAIDVSKRAVQERKKRRALEQNKPAVMDGLLHMRRNS